MTVQGQWTPDEFMVGSIVSFHKNNENITIIDTSAESNEEIKLPATVRNECGLESMRIKCRTTQDPRERKISLLKESVSYYLVKSCVVYSKYTNGQTVKPIELPETYSFLKFILVNNTGQPDNGTAGKSSDIITTETNKNNVNISTPRIIHSEETIITAETSKHNTSTNTLSTIHNEETIITTLTTTNANTGNLESGSITYRPQEINNTDAAVTVQSDIKTVEKPSHDEHDGNNLDTTTDGFKPVDNEFNDTDEVMNADTPTQSKENKTKSGYSYVIYVMLGLVLLALMIVIINIMYRFKLVSRNRYRYMVEVIEGPREPLWETSFSNDNL